MKLFRLFKKIDSESLKDRLIKKNAARNSILFVVGTLISALAFNLFLVPHGFVTGGLNGLAIIIRNFFPSVTNTMVLIFGNLLFIILSYDNGMERIRYECTRSNILCCICNSDRRISCND